MMGILTIISVILSASALILVIFALIKIYDHDAFHHFNTQQIIIKYPDYEKKMNEDNMTTCKAINRLYNLIDRLELERNRDPKTYDDYIEALVMAIKSLSKETKNDE